MPICVGEAVPIEVFDGVCQVAAAPFVRGIPSEGRLPPAVGDDR
jgi:hypothetical protein